jgi:hypothetical protein
MSDSRDLSVLGDLGRSVGVNLEEGMLQYFHTAALTFHYTGDEDMTRYL